MRKFRVTVASTVLLGTVALAAPALAGHDLRVWGVVTDFDRQDNGEEGFGEGDVIRMRADLFDEDGDEAGRSRSACEVTEYDRGEVHGHDSHKRHHENIDFAADCWAGFKLDDGAILTAGEITEEDFDDGVFTLAIKDGTGEYEDAEGTVDIEFLHDGSHGHSMRTMHSHGHGHGHGHDDHGDRDGKFVATFHFDN